ncbi:cytochrome p450 [Podospora aff. communis PSN243]|uniref:Cytochrome p450 n=1 Tax=Podospora aff. communis PSN243 TaxID=3040156 RepID=A0AAV9GHQ1_9PEZI|nr:cytochrome p450 [Podospora aff. communis PSN243]
MGVLQLTKDTLFTNWSTAAAVLASVLALLWLVREIYIWHIHLRHIPGPFSNSITCYYSLFTWGLSGRLNAWTTSQNEKYGRVIRIGPNHILTDDPPTLRRLGTSRSPYLKASWYQDITRLVKDVDSTLSLSGSPHANTLHHDRHALLAPTYAGRDNTSPCLEDVLDAQVSSLISYLDRKASQKQTVDFSNVAQYFALDAISAILWGEPFGFLRDDEDIGCYVQTMRDFLPIRSALSSLPVLPWLRPVLSRMLPGEGDEVGLGRLMGAARGAMEAREGRKEKGGGDMMQGLMERGLKGEELFSELVMAIVAGSDNTASALRMTLALLLTSPTAYHALSSEITLAIATAKISSPIRDAEAKSLPYLQAVIRETLRLYPLPAEFYKQVSAPEGDTICGVHLPAGTWLGCNMHSAMRRRDIWGEDGDLFRPERWIEAAEADEGDGGERFRGMCGMVDLTFGSGRFQCLGKALGWMELNKVVVEMLRCFDFAAVDPARPVEVGGYLMYLITGQVVRVTRK